MLVNLKSSKRRRCQPQGGGLNNPEKDGIVSCLQPNGLERNPRKCLALWADSRNDIIDSNFNTPARISKQLDHAPPLLNVGGLPYANFSIPQPSFHQAWQD
jgi:hypothetical protein